MIFENHATRTCRRGPRVALIRKAFGEAVDEVNLRADGEHGACGRVFNNLDEAFDR